jgi:hypothetical protein
MNKQWLLASGLVVPVLASFVACGGGEFCEESRTCAGDPAAAGAVATDGDPAGAGATGEGGQNGSVAGGGEGGQGVSPIGMPCTDDPECDDGDSCTGTEVCASGICEAGVAIECPAGMECSAEQDNACVFSSAAPWILFTADRETVEVLEAWGVKSDLLGQMEPVKLSPVLEAGWLASSFSAWSPDGSAVVLVTTNEAKTQAKSYLLRFGAALPEAPVELTEGMSPSSMNELSWSSTGKTIALVRDDGMHVVDVSDPAMVTAARLTTDGYDQPGGWMKSDTEAVHVARNAISLKSTITLAVREGSAWATHPLVSNLALVAMAPSPDRGLLWYVTEDAPNQRSLWSLEAAEGSQPLKVAGPARALSMYLSPDMSRYLLATTLDAAPDSDVFGGPLNTLSAPPGIKQGVALFAPDIIGTGFRGPWAPDSSRAAIFQAGPFGRQLVMYEPDAAEPWQPLPHYQAGRSDGEPVWSPSSDLIALPTRTTANALRQLRVVGIAGDEFPIDSVSNEGFIAAIAFSAGGEFMVYRRSDDLVAYQGVLVDLRPKLDDMSSLSLLDDGSFLGASFATTTLELIYVHDSVCSYIDLSGATPSAPVQVSDSGAVATCQFQPLPL